MEIVVVDDDGRVVRRTLHFVYEKCLADTLGARGHLLFHFSTLHFFTCFSQPRLQNLIGPERGQLEEMLCRAHESPRGHEADDLALDHLDAVSLRLALDCLEDRQE